MNVAELFVNLGVKGTDKSVKALTQVNNGLNTIKETSFATKAAILAAVYALERMTIGAANIGASFSRFEESTGLSSVALQKWQKELLQFGVGADEVKGNVMSLQSTINKMLMGEGVPKGLSLLFARAGIDPTRLKDTFYLMDKLRQVAKSTDVAMGRTLFESLGFSPDMYQALRRSQTAVEDMKANVISIGESRALEKIKTTWDELYLKVERFFTHLVARHGGTWVTQLSHAVDLVTRLATQVEKLGVGFDSVKVACAAIAAIMFPITSAIAGLIWLLGEWDKKSKNEKSIFGTGDKFSAPSWMQAGSKAIGSIANLDASSMFNKFLGPQKGPWAPEYGIYQPTGGAFTAPIINMNNYIQGGNPKDVEAAIQKGTTKGVRDAYNQQPKGRKN